MVVVGGMVVGGTVVGGMVVGAWMKSLHKKGESPEGGVARRRDLWQR